MTIGVGLVAVVVTVAVGAPVTLVVEAAGVPLGAGAVTGATLASCTYMS